MSETRTPEEEAIVKLEAQNARLRADLAALVPLARVGHGYIEARLAGQEGVSDAILALALTLLGSPQLDAARRVLAAYDQE